MSSAQQDIMQARILLLAALHARNYHFITPTPATHARVVARRTQARDLRDVFGWSLHFAPDTLEPTILGLLQQGELISYGDGDARSLARVSSLGDALLLHSAYPTLHPRSVFFGPDSYRFADFIARELPKLTPRAHIVDLGTGAGAGAIAAARAQPGVKLSVTDINSTALDYATINIVHAQTQGLIDVGASCQFYAADGLSSIDQAFDCVIANPPYIIDPARRAYRDGGAMHGAEVSLDWARQAAERLPSGGALLLYTGSAIINGEDRFKAALQETLDGFDISYRELDPDVFGEELERADYADVERIAVVGVVAVKK